MHAPVSIVVTLSAVTGSLRDRRALPGGATDAGAGHFGASGGLHKVTRCPPRPVHQSGGEFTVGRMSCPFGSWQTTLVSAEVVVPVGSLPSPGSDAALQAASVPRTAKRSASFMAFVCRFCRVNMIVPFLDIQISRSERMLNTYGSPPGALHSGRVRRGLRLCRSM
jgi:hypothetical protein